MISKDNSKKSYLENFLNSQRSLSFCLVVVSFIGLIAYDKHREVLPTIMEYMLGGTLYVLFWVFFLCLIFPNKRNTFSIPLVVTTTTCLIEFSQTLKFQWLNYLRSTKLGYAIFGSTFSWLDFPPYFIGGALSVIILKVLRSGYDTPKKSD